MLELAEDILGALAAGRRIAVATVVGIEGSAPRALASSMAVDETGRVYGSISGGCVEGAVFEAAQEVLASSEPLLAEFGIGDDVFSVGLSCGGRIQVFVHEPQLGERALDELSAASAGRPAGLAVVLDGAARGTVLAATSSATEAAALDPATARRILAELTARVASGSNGTLSVDCEDGERMRILFVVSATAPRMIVFGAVDFSAALADASSLLGYDVTICDARSVFATADRFPSADRIVVRWPSDYLSQTEIDGRTVVCVLSHDEKFDIPLLKTALRLPVGYVGAMGSRRTHERRVAALKAAGLTDAELARLHSPIGLDLGGSTPAETAVSILAEVIAARSKASAAELRGLEGPIHRPAAQQVLVSESGASA
jgi:xanthine dehydrogenase accessory factor